MRKDEEAKKQTVKISYEEFEKMAQSLIYYLNQRIKTDPSLEESFKKTIDFLIYFFVFTN